MSAHLKPALEKIALPGTNKTAVTVITVPLPKNHVGVIFGQHPTPAGYAQRFNSYVVDKNNIVQPDKVQAVWDSPTQKTRFSITSTQPPTVVGDPKVFSYGPYDHDFKIVIYCSHKKSNKTDFDPSDPHHSFHEFQIGKTTAIAMTMVNAEDGGDTDYFDTVVGIAVSTLTKSGD